MTAMKRQLSAGDADYDICPDPTAQQAKRQKLLQSDGKLHTVLLSVCVCLCQLWSCISEATFVWFQANNMRWINNFVVILISAVIRTCQPALFEYIRHLSAVAPAVCSWQQWMQCPEELMAGGPLWGLRGCKNWRAPFPGRMSYKATKPVVYLSMFYCIVVY